MEKINEDKIGICKIDFSSNLTEALGNEERYINALQGSGASHPDVMSLRHELEESIANFEKATGIKWPIR